MALTLFTATHFDEAFVQRKIMTYTIPPALILALEIGIVFQDVFVDVGQDKPFIFGFEDSCCDEGYVGLRWFQILIFLVVCCCRRCGLACGRRRKCCLVFVVAAVLTSCSIIVCMLFSRFNTTIERVQWCIFIQRA